MADGLRPTGQPRSRRLLTLPAAPRSLSIAATGRNQRNIIPVHLPEETALRHVGRDHGGRPRQHRGHGGHGRQPPQQAIYRCRVMTCFSHVSAIDSQQRKNNRSGRSTEPLIPQQKGSHTGTETKSRHRLPTKNTIIEAFASLCIDIVAITRLWYCSD